MVLMVYIAGVMLVKGVNGLDSPCFRKKKKWILALVDPGDLTAYAEE